MKKELVRIYFVAIEDFEDLKITVTTERIVFTKDYVLIFDTIDGFYESLFCTGAIHILSSFVLELSLNCNNVYLESYIADDVALENSSFIHLCDNISFKPKDWARFIDAYLMNLANEWRNEQVKLIDDELDDFVKLNGFDKVYTRR